LFPELTSYLSSVARFHLAEAGWEQLGIQPVAASTFTGLFFGWVVLVSVLNLVKDYSFMGLCILAAKNLFKRCAYCSCRAIPVVTHTVVSKAMSF
jgi:hypothetical protein